MLISLYEEATGEFQASQRLIFNFIIFTLGYEVRPTGEFQKQYHFESDLFFTHSVSQRDRWFLLKIEHLYDVFYCSYYQKSYSFPKFKFTLGYYSMNVVHTVELAVHISVVHIFIWNLKMRGWEGKTLQFKTCPNI